MTSDRGAEEISFIRSSNLINHGSNPFVREVCP